MSDSDSDIANYAYVWYRRDTEHLLDFTEGELDKIYEIMLNYSYPCYLTGSDAITHMTTDEKTMLLQHESLFIQKKMADAGLASVIMLQIPRILYDLFNLHRTHSNNEHYVFEYDVSDDNPTAMSKMIDYNVRTREYTDSVKTKIFELNAFIVNYVQQRNSMSNIKELYHEISQEILSRCWSNPAIIRVNPISDNGHKTARDERKNLIRQTIDFEKQYSQGRAILYRGASIVDDSLIDQTRKGSRSFNSSILSGCVNDRTACTLSIMSSSFNGLMGNINDKIICNIQKFIVHDSSNEDSLFFIPPIHPFVQLYCRGELFHPRTKLGSNFKQHISGREFSGLICPREFIEQCDYLISDKSFETLNDLYKRYKMTTKLTSVMDTFDRFPHRMKFPQVLEGIPSQIEEIRNKAFLKSDNRSQSVIGANVVSIPAHASTVARNAVVENENAKFEASGNRSQSVIGASTISVKGGRRTRRHKKRSGHKRSNKKRSNKRSGKRSDHKKRSGKSGNKRSGHKRSNKSRRC